MRLATYAAQKRYVVILVAGLVLSASLANGHAAENAFVIPAGDNDGYGIGDCMRSGSECGRVIADAWCEAHGRGKALAFGMAEDVTGAIPVAHDAAAASGDVVIRCGE